MRIAVVGGSLAGLFTATLLTQHGYDVTVYERSVHGLQGRGAGLLGRRETFAILRASGCEHISRVGVVARERIVFGDAGSPVVQEMPPQTQISWDSIYRIFRERMAEGTYLLDRKVEHLREGADRVILRFEDGGEAIADIVVGADGIASVVRPIVDGPLATNSYAGYVGWRGLLPEAVLPRSAAEELLDRFAYFRMPHSHIIGFLVLDKVPNETWRQYGLLFRKYSTDIITPELLAALAQIESTGNPVARTYWHWRLTWNPFGLYKPASSAVGLFQMTDAAYAEASRYCIRQHAVVSADCWFTSLYIRGMPSHSIELATVYLDRNVRAVLAYAPDKTASPQEKQDLAAFIHLCGARPARAFARRGFRLMAGERCGDHLVTTYLAKVNGMKRQFLRLAANNQN